jgi:hypothetical protein
MMKNRRTYTVTITVDVDPLKMSPFCNSLSKTPNGPTFGNIRNRVDYAVRDLVKKIAEDDEIITAALVDVKPDTWGDGITRDFPDQVEK